MNWSYDNSMARLGKSSVSGGYSFNANSVGNSSSSSSAGAIIGSIFGSLATGLGAALVSNKMSGAGKPSNKQISANVAKIVSEMPTQIANKVAKFNTNYGAAGVKISSDGTVNPSYEVRQKELTDAIATREKEVKGSNGKTQPSYQKYTEAKAVVTGLERGKTAYEAIGKQIENFDTSRFDIIGEKASIKEPSSGEYIQYLSKDVQDKYKDNHLQLCKLAIETNKYQDDKKALENKCKEYNNLKADQKNILNGLKDKDGKPITSENELSNAIKEAEKAVKEIEGTKIEGSETTNSQHDAAINSLKKQLKALGTKAEFDAAVQEIKHMNTKYTDVLKVQKEVKDVKEADNAVKNNKKTGNILNKLFGRKSEKNKAARAYKKEQQAQSNAAIAEFRKKYS